MGRGGVFITGDLPGGVHVRLVAPHQQRVEATARRLGVPPDEAARWVHEADRNRAIFYRRYWPYKHLVPETFTVTLNTAGLSEDQMAAAVLPLVPLVLQDAWDSAGVASRFTVTGSGSQQRGVAAGPHAPR